jgi:hypothetical protein
MAIKGEIHRIIMLFYRFEESLIFIVERVYLQNVDGQQATE